MGIVRAFDPDTGASGGPAPAAASGADLSALGFTNLDLTDGSWSFADTNSLVDTSSGTGGVTFSSGTNTIVMNADSGGTSNNAWGNSSTQEGPRWHRKLTVQDINGSDVQITSGDYFIFQTVMEYVAPSQKFAASMCVCVSASGAATAAGDADIIGGLIRYPASGAQQNGAIAGGFGAVNGNSNNHRTVTTTMVKAQRQGSVVYITSNSDGSYRFDGRDNPSTSYANGTTDLDLIVGIGTFSTGSITAGDDVKVKAWFRCIKMTAPS
jgi:hypothetical protein